MTDTTERLGKELLSLQEEQLRQLLADASVDELEAIEATLLRLEVASMGLDEAVVAAFAALEYVPTPRQLEFHSMQAWSLGGPFDVLYGGAAGGGKTLGLLMEALSRSCQYPGLETWIIRNTYPELRDSFIAELRKMRSARILGATWNGSEYALSLRGSVIKFRHGRTVDDVGQLLSAACQLLIIDERTTIDPAAVDLLASRVRSADRRVPIFGIRSGSNPGNVGHARVKADFIDPAPLGHVRIPAEAAGLAVDRYFIPARVDDNPHIDPDYYDRLAMLPPDLQAAYREGDWNRFVGMCFSEWRNEVHIIQPEDLPLPPGTGERGVGIDYGLAAPFCALWGAKLADSLVVIYRELYEAELTPTQQAQKLLDSEAPGERPVPRAIGAWLDPSCWARDPSSPDRGSASSPPRRSIAADYMRAGVPVMRANNDRLAGKRLVHDGLRVRADDRPRLLVYSTCTNLIRTLPSLPRSRVNPEDVDSKAEDHAYDALRYLLTGLLGAPGPATARAARGEMPSGPIAQDGGRLPVSQISRPTGQLGRVIRPSR